MYPVSVSDERSRNLQRRAFGARRRVQSHDLGAVRRKTPSRRAGSPTSTYAVFAAFLALSGVLAAYVTISLHRRSNINAAAPFHPARNAVIFVMSGYSGADIRGTDLPNISALAATGSQYARAW